MSFTLDILTPNSVIVKNVKAESLLVPTVTGQINILDKHVQLVAELETGILTVKNNTQDRHFSITTGIVRVIGDKVTILSEVTESSDKVDLERAKRAHKLAKEKLSTPDQLTDLELTKYLRKSERAEMRIRLGSLGKNA